MNEEQTRFSVVDLLGEEIRNVSTSFSVLTCERVDSINLFPSCWTFNSSIFDLSSDSRELIVDESSRVLSFSLEMPCKR